MKPVGWTFLVTWGKYKSQDIILLTQFIIFSIFGVQQRNELIIQNNFSGNDVWKMKS